MKASTILWVALLGTGALAEQAIRFTEIMYNPPPGPSGGEWVELYNRGYAPVDLGGWSLRDGIDFTFPEGTWIEPRSYLVVCGNIREFARAFPKIACVVGDFSGQLSDGGETVCLRDAEGRFVDAIRYGDDAPWPEAADGQGPSVELISFALDPDYGESWGASRRLLGTPGEPNTLAPRSSGGMDLIPRGAAWAYRKGTSEPPPEWRSPDFADALWPRGPTPFGYGVGREATLLSDMLNGYMSLYLRIRFEVEDPSAFASISLEVEYDDGYVVYLNGEEVARRDYGQPGEVMPHDAPAADGPLDPRLASHPLDPLLLRQGANTLAVQAANEAMNNRDFYIDLVLRGRIAPGGSTESLDLRINEVGRDGDGSWIEFFNEGRAPARLKGLILGFDLAHDSRAVLPDLAVPPYGHAVIREAELGIPLDAGVFVFLLDPEGASLIDGMPIPPSGASTGRYPDGDEDVYALGIATPGGRNDLGIRRDIAVTEIMYHPREREEEGEYIELHNRGADPVPLAGWSLAGAVRFEFPADLVLPPGAFLVVAADPDAVRARYRIENVAGPFRGRLRNTAETIRVLDPLGRPVDRVRYADDGDWPAQADGTGLALVLRNVNGENDAPNLWEAGPPSPGSANGPAVEIPPILRRERQIPAVPGPQEPVAIELEAIDDGAIEEVLLHWRAEGEATWSVEPMRDDGEAPDLAAGDGIYAGRIPGYEAGPNGTAILWYASAQDDAGRQTLLPSAGPTRPFIFRVEAPEALEPATDLPVYRIQMTDGDYRSLTTRPVTSDVLLPCSFVGAGRIFYGAQVRYRGQNARNCLPRSYRVEFSDERSFRGIRRLFLNGCNTPRQRMGLLSHRAAGLPGPRSRWVSLLVNGRFSPLHLEVERTDDDMLARLMPGDDEGNLYRGESNADLDYRGTDPARYRASYTKETNVEEDDYADVIELSRVFSLPDAAFIEEVWRVVDVDHWTRFFAIQSLVSNQENSIYRDHGDDYFLYVRPSDGRAILLPWDLDSVFLNPGERLFRPGVAAIRRFLTAPEIAPLYWHHLRDLLDHGFSVEDVRLRIQDLPSAVPSTSGAEADAFLLARTQFVRGQLHEELTVAGSQLAGGKPDLVPAGSIWKFFRGREEPSPGLEWTLPEFDDGGWESGAAGIGYADGDDATILADMMGAYTTVYLRRTFALGDPSEIASQSLWVDYDDGFVAYLNGTEIARANAGAAGTPLSHDARATAGHAAIVEGGTAFTLGLEGFVAAARAGANVLAVQALNNAIDSSDLTIHPAIRSTSSSGTRLFSGADGAIFYAGGALDLEGFAPAPWTSRILVDGALAAYDVLTGTWRFPALQAPPPNLRVQAVAAFGEIVAEKAVRIERVESLPEPVRRIEGAARWEAGSGPHAGAGTLTVAPGARLAIAAGASVRLQPGATIRVEGELVVEGGDGDPAEFLPASASGRWNQILIPAGGRATIEGARIEGGGSARVPIEVQAGGVLVLRDATVSGGAMLQAAGADVTIERCRFLAGPGFAPAIALSGEGRVSLREIEIEGGGGPGIEVAAGTVSIEGAIIHDRLGAGIRAAGGATACERAILHRLDVGAEAEARAVLELSHATVVYNGVAISAAAGSTVRISSSILWRNGALRRGSGLPEIHHCALQEIQTGEGNIGEDPLLADPRAGDFSLRAGSPAIGAGVGGTDMGAVQRGSPGIEYAGGDADGDGRLTIGDAIFLLSYLFAGGEPPACPEAADLDDDGQVTIGDAVYLLNHLFAGGPGPRRSTVRCAGN